MRLYYIYIILLSYLLSEPFEGLTLLTGGQGGGNQPKLTHLIDNDQKIAKAYQAQCTPDLY